MTQTVTRKSLYESDYLLWTQEVVSKLKARDFDNVDLENLIEEIEDLGHSKKDELKSRLNTLLEHLLKRIYVDMPQDFNSWQRTIREQRKHLDWLLDANPSLKTVWNDTFDIAWRYALRDVREDYPHYQFPDTWQFGRDIETILNTVFWE
ncbi:MAG: hypothetical protein AUK48_03375 [Oscillatoriales cyanobacterium CG2_30_44_21]|nr:MAG: hypothetical protein AUK48_03375 [Oscillatoriales cyanobacterium CG2_30_44_21]